MSFWFRSRTSGSGEEAETPVGRGESTKSPYSENRSSALECRVRCAVYRDVHARAKVSYHWHKATGMNQMPPGLPPWIVTFMLVVVMY